MKILKMCLPYSRSSVHGTWCFMVLIIVLFLLALIALNPIVFIITCEEISNLRNMYEILKIYHGDFF